MPYNLLVFSLCASGHTNPQLPLVEELVKRGSHVTYVCGKDFRDVIEKTGATWVEGSPTLVVPENSTDPDFDYITFFEKSLSAFSNKEFEVYDKELSHQSFDAILHGSFSIVGHILGERHGIPAIQLWASFAATNDISHLSAAAGPNDLQAALNEVTDKFLASHGASAYYPSVTRTKHNISFLPRFFQNAGDTFADNFHFIGPSMGKRSDDDLWNPSDDPRPLIFISLGTMFNKNIDFFSKCIAALADGKYQVVMSIGNSVKMTDLPAIPENFQVAASFPQPKLLTHASLFLSHAGMNSSMEGIYHQTPFLLSPQQGEQKVNAQKLVELGVGDILSPDCTAAEIREKIDQVIANPSYKEKLALYAQEIHQAGGAVRGADIVEHIIENARQTSILSR